MGTEPRVPRRAAFFLGVAVVGTLAALLFVTLPHARRDEELERWRTRAAEAERQLAALRDRLESVSAQLASVSARLEAVSQPAAVPTSSAQTCPSPPTGSLLSPPPPPEPTWRDPTHQDEWDALVAGALQLEVQRRLGRMLPPEQEQRLVETLAHLRDASRELSQEPVTPEAPASLRAHLTRTLVLLEADRTFRQELGIGVSDFLQGLAGDQIEEVAPVEPPSAPGP